MAKFQALTIFSSPSAVENFIQKHVCLVYMQLSTAEQTHSCSRLWNDGLAQVA